MLWICHPSLDFHYPQFSSDHKYARISRERSLPPSCPGLPLRPSQPPRASRPPSLLPSLHPSLWPSLQQGRPPCPSCLLWLSRACCLRCGMHGAQRHRTHGGTGNRSCSSTRTGVHVAACKAHSHAHAADMQPTSLYSDSVCKERAACTRLCATCESRDPMRPKDLRPDPLTLLP